MKNKHAFFGIILPLLITACSEPQKPASGKNLENLETKETHPESGEPGKTAPLEVKKQAPEDFLPAGFVIFDRIWGDLDRDGAKDLVLIIKGTDKSNFYTDEYRGELDRNRRGIIVLFNRKHGFEQAVKNVACFSSENEDGGVYYPPELSLEIKKGNLYVHYAHGRYGYWWYTFRYDKKSDFDLIGFDASENHGPIVQRTVSINFVTKRQQEKVNVNENTEDSGEEVFEESWKNIPLKKAIKLSGIKDFDELYFDY